MDISHRPEIMTAAVDAYSVAWESSQRRVMDHHRALQAALTAATPQIIADHYTRLDGPPTMTLEQLATGMVIKLPYGHHPWMRITSVGPVFRFSSAENKRAVQVVLVNGKKAGNVQNLVLHSANFEIKPGGA